jgi:hypothetical protein
VTQDVAGGKFQGQIAAGISRGQVISEGERNEMEAENQKSQENAGGISRLGGGDESRGVRGSWKEFHDMVIDLSFSIADLAELIDRATESSRWLVIAAIAMLRADGFSESESLQAIAEDDNWRTRTRAILDGWRPMALRQAEDGRMIDVDIDGHGMELSDQEFCDYQSLVKLQHGRMVLSFSDGRAAEFVIPVRLQHPERITMKEEEER